MNASESRTLVVLRHAKSAWPEGVPDARRPLGPRGLRDAPEAGRWLVDRGWVPQTVVCSPALRTRQTLELAAAAWDEAPPVVFDERVYAADGGDLVEVVRGLDPAVSTALLVGHQPGVQDLVEFLAVDSGGEAMERLRTKFPTSGLAVLALTGPWRSAAGSSARLLDFAVPRG
ncbi:SixA phosphatase family protein [Kitasatospora sp. DSM 101779]|uniref:SixA phosphatase family protein n=1 Tax=Kitasatospora sp. DSM 101779 TaxID=2853165 RepID=UPI0021DAA240|nr:histidine phosphatase family protein [Kitasatospora sp. DSM 101779]MCU7826661.1 histidine phosphatase family protein [Kitasatospora sp. DSM 101779]